MSDESDPLALAEYEPGIAVALTDADRWPGMTPADRVRLDAVLDHPHAPAWRHRTGHRLDEAAVARAREPLPIDGWLERHLATARGLPAYRGMPTPLDRLEDFPLLDREDLRADVTAFVPRDADLSRLVEGTSSGSTGAALILPDDVEDVARTFWLLVDLLGRVGVAWRPDAARMALAHVVHQRQAFTYASLVPGFDGAPMARLNLDPADWAPHDRTAFLADLAPQVYTGSPVSLEGLLDPALVDILRPLALVSGAMHLADSLRAALEDAFGVPVLDVYGLHETRPIAWRADDGPFRVLDRPVHVEVLDAAGEPVPPGERGEIVVTAGSNPLLPLTRYRTGDFGRLVSRDGAPAIADLEGREDVRFLRADGSELPCVDLTQYLQSAGCRGWSVRQRVDGSVTAAISGGDAIRVEADLSRLLGRPVEVDVVVTLADLGPGKPRRYARAAPSAQPPADVGGGS